MIREAVAAEHARLLAASRPGRVALRALALAVASWAILGLLAGCAETWVGPVQPLPQPAPVDPVQPEPPSPPAPAPVVGDVVPYEVVSRVAEGMTRDEVVAVVGRLPRLSSQRDDGTTASDWPALDRDGKPVWLTVIFGTDGKSQPHALSPRVP